MKLKYRYTKMNQEGFAPLIISIVIVTVLSLITLGFIGIMRNNQNNALNRQLNNGAYYASETGINDAIEAIRAGFNIAKNNCGPYTTITIPAEQYLKSNIINGQYNDLYSCLLINPAPSNLKYSDVRNSQPTVADISAINSTTGSSSKITSIQFSWQLSSQIESNSANFSFPNSTSGWGGCPSTTATYYFPPKSCWHSSGGYPYPGVLRIALTPIHTSSGGSSGRRSVGTLTDTSSTYTSFLYPASSRPSSNGLTMNSSTVGVNAGYVISGQCSKSSAPEACNITINVPNLNNVLLMMRSIYNPSEVTITAYNGVTPLLIRNAQTVIDSTGSYQGVLKRLQVRVPTLNDTGFPAYDIASSQNICMNLSAYPSNHSQNTQSFAKFGTGCTSL